MPDAVEIPTDTSLASSTNSLPHGICRQSRVPQVVVRVVVGLCFVWSLLLLLLGGFSSGKVVLTKFSRNFFPYDKKGGAPVLMLAVPILVAATVSSIFAAASSKRSHDCFFSMMRGERKRALALAFVLIPCIVYIASSIHGRLHGSSYESSIELNLLYIGNYFGMLAIIVMAFLLIPVSRLGPIEKLWKPEPALMTAIHIWSGRTITIGSILHGMLHSSRWVMQGESLFGIMLPPKQCWTNAAIYQPQCRSFLTQCSCYDHFRNFTGLIAMVGLVVIAGTSIDIVRRKMYALFYLVHITATPITIVCIFMHWNRSILYAAPGFLYYLAVTMPAWIERFRQRPVSIVTVNVLPGSSHTGNFIRLALEASPSALQKMRPGFFLYLRLPHISKVSHPFSVVHVPGRPCLEILFRTGGHFTRSAESVLATPGPGRPPVYCHGYYGSDLLGAARRHATITVIAAGIGITPYLTLLAYLADYDGNSKATDQALRKVVVHWVCRDVTLIDFCCREYFEYLSKTNSPISIDIIIHNTSKSAVQDDEEGLASEPSVDMPRCFMQPPSSSMDCDAEVGSSTPPENLHSQKIEGVPFSPTLLNAEMWGHHISLILLLWTGLLMVYYGYRHVQTNTSIKERALIPILVVLWGLILFLVGNLCSDPPFFCSSQIKGKSPVREGPLLHENMDESKCPEGESVTPTGQHGVSIQHTVGRPSIERLLESLQLPEKTSCPGLFLCAPAAFLHDVHAGVRRETGKVAIYEESFLI